jgi:hypothetical protein
MPTGHVIFLIDYVRVVIMLTAVVGPAVSSVNQSGSVIIVIDYVQGCDNADGCGRVLRYQV